MNKRLGKILTNQCLPQIWIFLAILVEIMVQIEQETKKEEKK